VEFVHHSKQVLDALAGSLLDGSRLAIEVVRLMEPAKQIFTPVGGIL
jgi:hypothetical protein